MDHQSQLSVHGNFRLLGVSLGKTDVVARVLINHFEKELESLEKELTRINGAGYQVNKLNDVYQGMRCVAFDATKRKFLRCEVCFVFMNNLRSVTCRSLDHGHKFSTTADALRPLPRSLSESNLPYRCIDLYLTEVSKASMCVVQQADFDEELELSQLVNLDFTNMVVNGFLDVSLCGDICLGDKGMLSLCLQNRFQSELKPKPVNQNMYQFDYIEMLSVKDLKFSTDRNVTPELLNERIEQFNDGVIPESDDKKLTNFERDSDRSLTKTTATDRSVSANNWQQCFDMINLNDLNVDNRRGGSNPVSKLNTADSSSPGARDPTTNVTRKPSPQSCGHISSENELAEHDKNRCFEISDLSSQKRLDVQRSSESLNRVLNDSSGDQQKKLTLREIGKRYAKRKAEKASESKEQVRETEQVSSTEIDSNSAVDLESRSKKPAQMKRSTSISSVKSSSSENDFRFLYEDQDFVSRPKENENLSAYFQLVNEGLRSEFYYDAIVVGKKSKMWVSEDDFLNNVDWKMSPEFIYPLSALVFPICSIFGSDIVAINSSEYNRKMLIVNFALWAQASRMVRSFEEEQLDSMRLRGINLQGPAILLIVPNWSSVQLMERTFNRRLSAFKNWRPHIVADFGWGIPTKCQHLVTTPVRLLENLENGTVNLNRVKLIMMEECDIIFDSFNKEIVECMNKFKRSESQRVVNDWRLMLFSKSYHRKIDSFLKIRTWRPEKRIDNISYMFTDLFLGTAFLGVSHVPLICSHKIVDKLQLAKQVLKQNCSENSAVVIVCQSEETCLYLTSKLFNEGYNVNCVTDEIKQKMQPVSEDSSCGQRKSTVCVTIVITADRYLDRITDLEIPYNFAIFYEGVDCHDSDSSEFILNRRCSVLMDTLDGKTIKNPKIFHFISEKETVEYIVLLKTKFERAKSRNNWSYSVEQNFQMMLEELYINCEKQKATTQNRVPLCQKMLLNPQYATQSKRFINCGNLLCTSRHQILSCDQPGSDVKCVKLPAHGYFRVRVRQVLKANEFYATLEDYRETQSEPYKEMCREVLCQIEEEIDELVPFMRTADASTIRVGKLYIFKRNRIYHRGMVTNFEITTKYGSPTSVTIFRVDAGDTITNVDVSVLFDIPQTERDLRRIPGQAFKVVIMGICSLDGSDKFPPQVVKYVEDKISGKLLEGMIVLSLSNVMFVHLLTLRERMADGSYPRAGYRIKNDLLEKRYCVKNENQMFLLHEAAKEVFEDLPVLKKLLAATDIRYHETDSLEPEKFSPVFLVPNRSKKASNEFFLLKKSTRDEVEKLQEKIEKQQPEYKHVSQTEPGKYLVANIKAKNGSSFWARAKVVKVSVVKREANVFLIDAGEMHVVKYSRLKHCPNDVFALPSAAICCSLVGIRPIELSTGYSQDLRNFLTKLSDDSQYEIAAFPANRNQNGNSNASLIPVELYYKSTPGSPGAPKPNGSEAKSKKFSTLSKVLCSEGLAVGTKETMEPVFTSKLKDQLLDFHISTDLSDDDRAEMLHRILKHFDVKNKDCIDDFENVIKDIIFILCSYRQCKVLKVALATFILISKNCEMKIDELKKLVQKCFHNLKDPSIELVEMFYELLEICVKDLLEIITSDILSALLDQLSLNISSLEMVNELLKFIKLINLSELSNSEVERCVIVFTSILRNHSINNLPVIPQYVKVLSKDRLNSFVESLNISPSFLSLFLRNFARELDKAIKIDMILLLSDLMEIDRLKFVIGNSNTLLEALEHDINPEMNPGRQNLILRNKAKSLYDAIMTYKRELINANSFGPARQGLARTDVRELSDLGLDLSVYDKLTPKIIWWQSENRIYLEVNVFGTRAKRITYNQQQIDIEVLTNDEKFYAVTLILKGEVLPIANERDVFVTGRSLRLELVKKESELWDQLTENRMTNVVYNMEKMADAEENNNNADIKWVQNRGATVIRNCVPDSGLPNSSADDENSSLDADSENDEFDEMLNYDD